MENDRKKYSLNRLSQKQWADYKSIRLEALLAEPDKFGSSYDSEVAKSDQDWQKLLMNNHRAIFGLYFFDKLIGLTGVALYNGNPNKAIFFSSYIKKEHRGNKLAMSFYQKRIAWARDMQCSCIIVSHREGNDASKAANQRFGFSFTHLETTVWPDGKLDNEVFYKLDL